MPRLFVAVVALWLSAAAPAADPWFSVAGADGPGKGKHVVLVSGDEEYRSEEALPQLAKILAKRYGFDCTVLFAVDPKTGFIDPNVTTNIPGTGKLAGADLMVIATRFRNLPDAQMRPIADYLERGKPVVGLRTATHAFKMSGGEYKRFSDGGSEKGWEGGFGRKVLGEKWVNHHGDHGKQGTRGVIAPGQAGHPVVRGIAPGSIFGTTDVYVAAPVADSTVLVLGQVTKTLDPDSPPVAGKKNDPMMPVAWTREYQAEAWTKPGRVFTTTMGASQDLAWEGTRRLVVNGCLWAAGVDVPPKSDVTVVGEYKPTPFKGNGAKKGVRPEDVK